MRKAQTRRQPKMVGMLGAAVLAFGLGACDDTSPAEITGTGETTVTAGTDQDVHIPGGGRGTAVYVADLEPLNANAAFGIDAAGGKALITERGGRLEVKVNARGLAPNTIHPQHIHVGDACPTDAQDVNSDGFVDVLEGVPTYGAILVPLDSDLADLGSQLGGFPVPGNANGAITYRASASVAELNAATQGAIGEDLRLSTRHIVLHGVAPDSGLPGSVASIGGFPAEVTLPVACGELRQVNTP